MGIFDFLKGKNNDDALPGEKVKKNRNAKAVSIVKNDLIRLSDVTPGLGAKAISYVIAGDYETVLATLSNGNYHDTIEVGTPYVRKKMTEHRRNLFARMQPYDIDFVVRYAQILSACMPAKPKASAGSSKIIPAVGIFFYECFIGVDINPNRYSGPEKSKDYKTRVTPEIALEVTEKLGGTQVDYFDALYQTQSYWMIGGSDNYRSVIDIKPVVVAHAEAAVAAAKRVNTDGRERFINDITKWGLLEKTPFFEYVFDALSDGSKKVRGVAAAALKIVSAEKMETIAITELGTGTVGKRAAMVDLLAGLGTPTALGALTEHKKKEKAARVIAAIDTVIAVEARTAQHDAEPDDKERYLAIDGSRVNIPPMKHPKGGDYVPVTAAERTELQNIITEENVRLKKQIEENKRLGYHWKPSLIKMSDVDKIIKAFNPQSSATVMGYQYNYLTRGAGLVWVQKILEKQPKNQMLTLCLDMTGGVRQMAHSWVGTEFKSKLVDYLNSEDGDIRYLEGLDVLRGRKIDLGDYQNRHSRKTRKGDFLRYTTAGHYGTATLHEDYALIAVWPYIAENLAVLDEAFGLSPQQEVKLRRSDAISALTALPKTPMRFFGPLLEAATGQTKAGRQEARDMLSGAEDVNARLETLLSDTRQAVRAGAADWMGERGSQDFVKPLKARLKKEKSEVAKAAMLNALDRLGEDLSSYVGPKVLIAEAETNMKKAKFDKLNWLGLDHLPAAAFKSGARVPDTVLKWWIYLAFKLKEPGGNKLFQLYLDQLTPESGETFSTWILDSWINYDTQRAADEDANKHAKQYAKGRYDSYKRWYKEYTVEQAFADLKREFMSNYLNSGAASKGVLALAYKAKPNEAANRVGSFLKVHGSRTSQASALLTMLAAKADPVSLQVVIAAATRLKQKGVQKYANDLLQKVADDKDWTMDELADRTIPTAGFDDSGILELPCGPDEKLYTGVLTEDLKIELRNPDGKTIKGLASTPDENTKTSKKQLSTSRKELKQVVAMQSGRLYEALCAERVWTLDDWVQNFAEHPVMRKLTERIVWMAMDEDGGLAATFRPTAEGDYTGADDEPVDIKKYKTFRIAHGASLTDEQSAQWNTHLEDYEIKPLFAQFGRGLKRPTDEEKKLSVIEDRKGWVTDTFTVRGIASKHGYDRGEAMDAGYFNEYTKTFRSAGVIAVIEFSGNCLPEENVAAAMVSLHFEKVTARRGRGGKLKLGNVPPVLLSECWNDYHAMAGKGVYEENWEKRMPYI